MALTQVQGGMLAGSTNTTTTIQSNGTTAITVNSSQNVGVGTASPTARLHVYGGSNNQFKVESSGAEANFTLAGTSYGQINNSVGDWYLTNDASANMIFRTASTERMRISATGNVGIGNSSPPYPLSVASSTADLTVYVQNTKGDASGDIVQVAVTRNTTNGTTRPYTYYNTGGGAYRFYVLDSGNCQNTNGSYGAFSDVKLKENIVDATPKLADLCKVKVRQYNLKKDQTHKQIGVIAQELEEVFAGLVEEIDDRDADGNDLGTTTKTVKYSVFVPMLIKAIQELKAELDATKAEVAALKAAP